MDAADRQAIDYLRQTAGSLLTKHYDTDYNILRWVQGYNHNLDEAKEHFLRHLKFRHFYGLDDCHGWTEHEILKKYFPLGLVGETGMDNRLLVIESAGRIDLQGILKAVQLSDFLTQRFRFQEKMLNAINDMERKNDKQSSVIYVLDLEGLKFDPSLLPIATGPYRILWASVYTSYPEWISHMFIVNAPSFMSLIWKGIGPLLPERTRNKVSICTTNSNWRNTLLEYVKPEKLPKHWGGTMVDASGDAMCRDRLIIPMDPIPKDIYWTPTEEAPAKDDLTPLYIPAGQAKVVTFTLPKLGEEAAYIILNRFCDRTFGMAIYTGEESDLDTPIEDLVDWCPDFDYPAMPTVDYLKVRVPQSGVFKVKFGNEQAWIRSLTVYYRIYFVDENNKWLDFITHE